MPEGRMPLPGGVAPLLRCGSGLGYLMHRVPSDQIERDALAGQMLRRATGLTDVAISRRPSGRPRLQPPYPELGVSMSSRAGYLLVGFSPAGAVGVDIETGNTRKPLDPMALALDHFSTNEARRVAALAPRTARDLFLRLWVAKEAVLKLTGRGVFDGLREPDLSRNIEQLQAESVPVEIVHATLSDCRVQVRCLHGPATTLYCALAHANP